MENLIMWLTFIFAAIGTIYTIVHDVVRHIKTKNSVKIKIDYISSYVDERTHDVHCFKFFISNNLEKPLIVKSVYTTIQDKKVHLFGSNSPFLGSQLSNGEFATIDTSFDCNFPLPETLVFTVLSNSFKITLKVSTMQSR